MTPDTLTSTNQILALTRGGTYDCRGDSGLVNFALNSQSYVTLLSNPAMKSEAGNIRQDRDMSLENKDCVHIYIPM